MRAFGIDDHEIETIIPSEDDHFEVWPENWSTVMVFLALQTQWQKEITMAGQVFWHGIRYSDAESTIRLMGYRKDQATIFKGLMQMEHTALPFLNEQKK